MLINSLADLDRLGRIAAESLAACSYPPLFLSGPLGAGKTALTASICKYWPGCEEAEVSSPSFTVSNIYPGSPPVMHCDLYRSHSMPDEILELAEEGYGQLVVEWAEFMPDSMPIHLDICFNVVNDSRRLELRSFGGKAGDAKMLIEAQWARSHS